MYPGKHNKEGGNMNTHKMLMAALVLAIGMSGTAQAALQGRDLNGSIDSFEAYYDTDLNITWLADANYGAGSSHDAGTTFYDNVGAMTWQNALDWAENLSIADNHNNIIYDNWRLPVIIDGTNGTNETGEMAHLYFDELGNEPAYWLLPGGGLTNTGPFVNIQTNGYYWSSTTEPFNPGYALLFGFFGGFVASTAKDGVAGYAWAVSDGDVGVAAVPEAETYAMMLAGLGLVGAMARRRKQAEV
jgi:hypothetical protein